MFVMAYQQESEISQSHAMALLTEYISLYLSNIIYSSYIYRTELMNMWYLRHKERAMNHEWVAGGRWMKAMSSKSWFIWWWWMGGGVVYLDSIIIFEDNISQKNQIPFLESLLVWSYCKLLPTTSICLSILPPPPPPRYTSELINSYT